MGKKGGKRGKLKEQKETLSINLYLIKKKKCEIMCKNYMQNLLIKTTTKKK